MKNIEETKAFMEKMQVFFETLEDEKNKTQGLLDIKELEQEDLLHEIEISKMNAIEMMSTFKRLKKTRKERRKYKDELQLIKTLKGFADEFIKKGICRELKQAINNIDMLEKTMQERTYNPRILKDLKCNTKVENKNEKG